ncbi:MAG: hypothetical protein CMD83_03640 [Gammaproteobacteria bacterium]|nr:hypothetical protein [Gammaproteobacteria bacterium]
MGQRCAARSCEEALARTPVREWKRDGFADCQSRDGGRARADRCPFGLLGYRVIQGETGTGKELVARALHRSGLRRAGAFVALNCSNLTGDLLESQLFGHRKGAFTGAHCDQQGLLAESDGGTLFLDEVVDMPRPNCSAPCRSASTCRSGRRCRCASRQT